MTVPNTGNPSDNRKSDQDALQASDRLLRALTGPGVLEPGANRVRVLETHISWVLLAGSFAYKIKKPVNFGFLDFSTLERRRHYCEQELRLNRRFAPQIYLDVVAITGSPDAPRLQGNGEAIEYAVRMKQFPQRALLSVHASEGTLSASIVDAIARCVGRLHAESARAPDGSGFGSPDSVQHWSEENLVQLASTVPASAMPGAFERLRRWYRELPDIASQLNQRRQDGHVRDCHGDLHLGNMALIDDRVTPFDCIEFNDELRWIDTISEAAFVAMDLEARGYPGYSWRFIGRYLEQSADYQGVVLLRYYVVYRALVRAKVEALRAATAAGGDDDGAFDPACAYLELAEHWASRRNPGLVIMHGLSGSGKSTVAVQLAESLGAIQLRSDVVRKQLFELEADADSGSPTDQGIYGADATSATYRRLEQLAESIIDCEFPAILDATYLLRSQRQPLLQLAAGRGCPCVLVDCDAPLDTLRSRIEARSGDPSEADLQVLERQLERHEPVSAEEGDIVTIGAEGLQRDQLERISDLLAR